MLWIMRCLSARRIWKNLSSSGQTGGEWPDKASKPLDTYSKALILLEAGVQIWGANTFVVIG